MNGPPGRRERIRQEYADALATGGPAVIDLGRTVLCDGCDEDLTDDPRSGGFLFGSYAYGPCCADRRMATIRSYGEERFIKAHCPEGVSFADWCRNILRAGNNTITITPGLPGSIR